MHLPEGTLLQNGKYKIVRFIASGGFGCTYEGVQTMMGARVAIKEFFVNDFCNREEDNTVNVGTKSKVQDFQKLKKSFIKEATVLFNMQNPHIVRVIDVFEENGTAYYVMDYIDGTSLAEIVSQKGKLHEDEALGYIFQVGDALKYVHGQNRLHLDIKPGNVMIDKNGKAILIDFGASKYYNEETGEQTSALAGVLTKPFAPIEQIKGSFNTFSPAADIYALGATLYKLLTGKTPVDALDRLTGSAALQPLPSNISPSTRKAVESAMQINNADRPQTIYEFEKILMEKVDGNKDERTIYDGSFGTVNPNQKVGKVGSQGNIKGNNNAYQPSQPTIDERTIIDSSNSKENPTPKYYSPGFPSPNQNPVSSGKIHSNQYPQGNGATTNTPKTYPNYPNNPNNPHNFQNNSSNQYQPNKGGFKPKTSILKRLLKIFLWVIGSILTLIIIFIIFAIFNSKPVEEPVTLDSEYSIEKTTSDTSGNKINGHTYVDLGLPSGLKWATCNVGATLPEEYGRYFAWGEAATKGSFSTSNSDTYGKDNQWLQDNGYIGEEGNLNLKYDAANQNWGGTWRMPTYNELEELIDNTNTEWINLNGINGFLVKSKKNDNKIFLPATGYMEMNSVKDLGDVGRYWTSTPGENDAKCAYNMYFLKEHFGWGCNGRAEGRAVRPVSD